MKVVILSYDLCHDRFKFFSQKVKVSKCIFPTTDEICRIDKIYSIKHNKKGAENYQQPEKD